MSGLSELTLGFIPLTDCAPIVAAEALGFFEEEGLAVALIREASWATIRDKLAVGALDGAHMLAPMALAADGAILAPLTLNRNGSAITVSTDLAARVGPRGEGLAEVVASRRAGGQGPLTFGVVFPQSVHNYLLRAWLADQGIDPDRDVRIVVIPPPRMVERMRDGEIDGFCVGAPWNAVAEAEGLGRMLITASQLCPGGPDKVLGVRKALLERRPEDLRACLRAAIRGAAWADDPANREDLVTILARPDRVGAAPAAIARALEREIVFHRDGASLPRREDGLWMAARMVRWGQLEAGADLDALVDRVYRPDLYRVAAQALGQLPA